MRQDAETQQLKSKLKIAVEKLKYVSRYLDDGHIVDETISEIGDINVYECKKCWRVMALQKDV